MISGVAKMRRAGPSYPSSRENSSSRGLAAEVERVLCDDGHAGLDRFGERDVVEPDEGDFVLVAGVVERAQSFDRDQVLAGEERGRGAVRAEQFGGEVVGVGGSMPGVADEVGILEGCPPG